MVLNLGYIELGGGEGLDVKVYYDAAWLNDDPTRDPSQAPLIDGPRGFCLDLSNTTGKTQKLTVLGLSDQPTTINIGQGDPVTGGPQNGRSKTAAEMAALGFTTRGNIGTVILEPQNLKG